MATMLSQLTGGMVVSIEIFLLTLLFSLPLGLVVAFGRMSKNGIIKGIVKIYIAIMRGTPLMLQLIVVYFAPFYVFGIKISQSYRFVAVIIAFSINYAAYFAEIYRAAAPRFGSPYRRTPTCIPRSAASSMSSCARTCSSTPRSAAMSSRRRR